MNKIFAKFDENGVMLEVHTADGMPYNEEYFKNSDFVEISYDDREMYCNGAIRNEQGLPQTPAIPLDVLKFKKNNEFKSIRDSEEVKPITYQGYNFDYDEKARDRINAAIIALDASKGQIAWTTADNTEVLVNADDLRGVIAAVAMRSNELHVKYRKLKEQVEACTTKEQLESIVWE